MVADVILLGALRAGDERDWSVATRTDCVAPTRCARDTTCSRSAESRIGSTKPRASGTTNPTAPVRRLARAHRIGTSSPFYKYFLRL